jgi:hypothetical protein
MKRIFLSSTKLMCQEMTLFRKNRNEIWKYVYIVYLLFFWIRGNLIPRKAYFVGPDEGVKFRLSQTFTRGARPDSNSRPAVQISNPLPSRYAP